MPMRIADVAAEAQVVGERVADVGGDRLDAVLGDHRGEQLVAAPAKASSQRHLAPRVALADQRLPQAVGVVVEVAERRCPWGRGGPCSTRRRGRPGSARPGRRPRGSRARTSPRTAGRCGGGPGAHPRPSPSSPSSRPPCLPSVAYLRQATDGAGPQWRTRYRVTPVSRHAAAHRSASTDGVAPAAPTRARSITAALSAIAPASSVRSRSSGSGMHAWAMPTTA